MITYLYKCKNCEEYLEVRQSIKDAPLIHCENCDQDDLERQITGGGEIIVQAEAKTLGVVANRNNKKFGRQYCEDKTREIKARGKLGRKKLMGDRVNRTEKPVNTKAPWRSGDKPDLTLNQLTREQKLRYIETGYKPK